MSGFGFFLLIPLSIFAIPYFYLPVDNAPLELIILGILAFLLIPLGFILNKLRSYAKAELFVNSNEVKINTNQKNLSFEIKEIDKISESDYNSNLDKTNFKIITSNKLEIEIKADTEIYEYLINAYKVERESIRQQRL